MTREMYKRADHSQCNGIHGGRAKPRIERLRPLLKHLSDDDKKRRRYDKL